MAITHRPFPLEEKRGWGIADPSQVRRRAWLCVGILCLAFGGLLARLWYLQVVEGAEMLAQAQHNRIKRVPLPAPRGLVLDRHLEVLATSRASHSVAVVPAALPSAKRDPDGRSNILKTLGFLLHAAPSEIEAQLQEAHAHGGHDYDPVRVAEGVDLPTLTLIEENKRRLAPDGSAPAVLITDDIARTYPNAQLASHILGYTGRVNEEDINASEDAHARDPATRALRFDDIVGKSGIEKEYDNELSGIDGSEQYEVDARLRPVQPLGSIKEKPGHTLVLTIDAKLQRAAEQALGAARNSGAVVAVDPRNGEVLALASRPTFDPNIFSLPPRSQAFRTAYKALVQNSQHPLVDRAVTSRFPPGSTFKMVTASAGLQQGTITPGIVRHCGGGYHLGHAFFGCWQTHGEVNLMTALAKSCDVYFYEAALQMGDPESTGPAYLAQVARHFGLGQRTGIDLPVDAAGLIPDPEWRAKYHAGNPSMAHWYPGNTLNMSIGQGDVLTTPLQMSLVASAVANGGTLWKPHLLKEVRDSNNKIIKQVQPQGRSVEVERRYLDLVRAGMRLVVTNGTGKVINLPQVEVAGKTGSAEDSHHALPHAWFVCFAPYQNPQIAIACMVENAGHGSENAAPVAKKILEAMFPPPKLPAGVKVAER
ncbi:MAG: penicillin-binding protein 2 [Abitibacteriaceae bacterium]|nr:penicillin-binding protein 2 [Abditibacteriaceae bacterium]